MVLEQLKDASWGEGGNVGQVNAVRAMALTIQTPLRAFLEKIEKYRRMVHGATGLKTQLLTNAKKVQWALAMREDVGRLRAVCNCIEAAHPKSVAFFADYVGFYFVLNFALPEYFENRSRLSRIDSRTEALQRGVESTRDDLLNMIHDCRNSYAEAHRDVNRSLQRNETASTQRLSRLVEICVGISVDVKDFRCVLDSRHTRIDQRFQRLEGLQQECLAVIPTTARGITNYIDRVTATLRPYLEAFQELSAEALDLLKRILQTNIEVYPLLQHVQAQLSRPLSSPTEDCIRFQDGLGRLQELPYNWFRQWEIFEAMLRCTFKGLPGE